jgi:cyclohexanone monooxygenase
MNMDALETIEAELGIDPATLRAKYRAERDKRLRPEGIAQFLSMKGELARYRQDTNPDAQSWREPLADEIDVAVIGCGFGGLLAGAHMRKAGIENIRFIDRAGDFGGVWYWNRYPGAACDTESYVYLPMLEELGVMPARKYAKAAEIHAHCLRIAGHFDLYRDTCFHTDVTGLEWDEDSARWLLTTDRGDAMRARFVLLSPGPLDRPKLPGIPGIGDFKGHAFHTSRWDYAYTGGSSEGGLNGLADKVVGIIGTGATAVQCIPHLAQGAKHLYVFQRTPSSIDVRDDRPTDPAWFQGQAPGWQRERIENFTTLISGGHADVNLTDDGWTGVYRNVQYLSDRLRQQGEQAPDPGRLAQLANFMKMEELRTRVAATVADRNTAEALKPWYDHFCKRPCFHDDYLKAFNRDNVTLVDTAGAGVERITQDALVAGGKEYPVDCLVYSTGFEVGDLFAQRIGFDIVGRSGTSLTESWATGPRTLHGFLANGFPNLFFVSHVQAGLSLNFTHTIDEQGRHLAYILGRAMAEGAHTIEATQAGEQAWVEEVERAAPATEAFNRECTPSYLNFEGDRNRSNIRNAPYGGGPMAYFAKLAEWRAEGSMAGLEMRR